MKKSLLLLFACLFISAGVQAQVPLTSISLDYTDVITLNVGEDTTLVVTFNPPDATDKVVSWKIDNVNPAGSVEIDTFTTVDKTTCIVRGINKGEAVITVKGASGTLSASCTIKVIKPVVGMALSVNTKEMILGRDTVLIARINPFDATNTSVKWVSRDSSLVNIESINDSRDDTLCKIIAIKPGVAWIVAETVDGNIKDSCEVTVVSAPIQSFTLNYDSIKILKGAEATIIAQIRPLVGTYKYVTWENKNFPAEDIIEIIPPLPGFSNDTICRIRATGPGEAKIIAEYYDGQLDTCVVTVETLADSVVMNYRAITLNLYTDSIDTLTARIYPAISVNKNLTWTTSDANLVRIDSIVNDSLGYIKALRAGTAVIYAMSDNLKKDSCIVTISPRLVDSLKINKSSLVNDTLTLLPQGLSALSVTVFPWNATNDTIRYESSDPEVARIDTVSNSIYIRALTRGTAIIYAKAIDGSNAKDSCIVKVSSEPVTSISLNADTIRIYEQYAGTLIARLLPANANNKSVVWSTNDNSVVRIESSTGTDTILA